LLILGGTLFLGRHLAEGALARGHSLSLFNRGRTAPELFPEAERLRGDRDGDLDVLRGREWDAVIDTSGRWRLRSAQEAQQPSPRWLR
jgi:2'-hydroxyisoflavone reductase